MFRANNFDKLLDKATSNLRLDPDWPTILQICDLIRQNDCTPKYAIAALKKKLYSQNPHQAMFALLTLESVVKNCGPGIHDEVASKAFCEMLRDLVKTTHHENLRTKILELIQAWGFAFRNNPKYRAVQDTVNILKAESFKFPPLKESDAMFSADTAPEWADGEVCHRCRVAFSLMVRRHHCRACGQVFCQQCSSKSSTLPKFGIEKEVRVCDACYDKVSRPPTSTAKLEIVDTSSDYGPTQPQKRPGKSDEELRLEEEEQLQLALAMSQSEAEHKEKERRRHTVEPTPSHAHPAASSTVSSVSASPEHAAPAAAELSRYLDRNYWEQRLSRDTNAPTAPASHSRSDVPEDYAKPATSKAPEDDNEDQEIDDFVEKLKSQVEIFVNRMKSNSSRGRSIANDTSVQSLFMNITAMHSQLLRYIQQQDDKRVYLESLQDKINQIRDSRAALDTLRAEHAARLAAAAEAAERQRQMQMAAKLQAMRKKKHEYLQYQRQLALQRVQEQEREMQMRQEQQKHQYMMAAGSGYFMPGVSLPQYQPPYAQSMYAVPQFHPQMMPQTTDGSVPLPGQPLMSTANMMNLSQMGAMSQSMPQLPNNFSMSTTGVALAPQPGAAQSSMAPQNIRPVNQQIPLQQQMMIHQMRMAQPGMHQLQMQGVNGMPGQNVPQQNGQVQQLPKQSLSNQQQPTSMMGSISIGQQNMGQPQMTQANSMLGMQVQNMRMPLMQGQGMVSGYQLNQPNNPGQQQNVAQQSQIPGQPMSLPGQQIMQQGPHQSMPQGQIPNSQNSSQMQHPHNQQMQPPSNQQIQQPQNQPNPPLTQQMSQLHQQGQQMSMPGQQLQQQPGQQLQQQPGQQLQQQPGQQINMQAPQMLPQGQNLAQPGQHMVNPQQQQQQMQMGQLGQQHIQMGQLGQQSQHGQVPQQMQMGQVPQQVPSQGQQQVAQGQPIQQQMLPGQQMPQNSQGQPMKMPSQNFSNGPPPPAPPPSQQSSLQNQGAPPAKPEHNNNTAELISFD